MDLFMRCHMTTLHTVPLIGVTINVALTDMVLIKKDWPKMIYAGLVYMLFNMRGQYAYSTAIYPETDWVGSPIGAFVACIGLSLAQAGVYYLYAILVDKFKAWVDADEP